jgi:phage-related protein
MNAKPTATQVPQHRLESVYILWYSPVHGFIKKAQKTPEADLELVRKRTKEMRP